MKERPILFSASTVIALRGGIKTQTRRTRGLKMVNEVPDAWVLFGDSEDGWKFRNLGGDIVTIRCPYGVAGDRLWTREAYQLETLLEDIPAGTLKNSKDPVRFCGDSAVRGIPIDDFGRVRSSRFMPRRASRDDLEIISTRPERLHAITEKDTQSEGLTEQAVREVIGPIALRANAVPEHWIGGYDEGSSFCRSCAEKTIIKLRRETPGHECYLDGGWATEGDSQAFCERCHRTLDNIFTTYACQSEIDHFRENSWSLTRLDCLSLENILESYGWCDPEKCQPDDCIAPDIHRLGFQALWDSINGIGSWAKNPWVWRIEFRRLVGGKESQ